MEQIIQILKSKLLPPYSSDTIKRERIFPLLSEIPRKRLVTVIAGAGFGKTTLIADAMNNFGLDAVWYRIDKSDRDFITFLSYLIAGIKKYAPDFGADTYGRLEKSKLLSREYEATLTVFLGEIEKHIKNDLIIILDDYHLAEDSIEINEALEYIIENMPVQLHFVIISRSDPDLHLSKFRARREILDIREQDIVFTIPEVEKLYSQIFGINLQHESLQSLHQKTDGWVSGLILFYHSIKGKGEEEIENLLLKLKGSHRNISNYLEENVFDMQTEEIKDFLIKTSILSRLNASFCDKLLGKTNSEEILKSLEENHLFTFSLGMEKDSGRTAHSLKIKNASFESSSSDSKEWHVYHHLFNDFLQNKLYQDLDKKTVQKLHTDAAALWGKLGEEEEALSHYLLAEQFDRACLLLGNWGLDKLKVEGRLQLINSYLKKIPESYFNREPWIQYLQAHVYELSGKLEEAIGIYKMALKSFRRLKEAGGEAMCKKSLVFNYFIYGDHKSAENILKDLPEKFNDFPQTKMEILGVLAFFAAHQLKLSAANKYISEGLAIAAELGKKNVLSGFYAYQAFLFGIVGDFGEMRKIGDKIGEMENEIKDPNLLAILYVLISFSNYFLGNYTSGLEAAKKGMDIVAEKGLQDQYYASLLMFHGFNSMAAGLLVEAVNNGKECLRIFKDVDSRWSQAHAYLLLFLSYMKINNIQAAEQSIKSGLEIIKGLELPFEEGILKIHMAYLYLEKRQFARVKPLLDEFEGLLGKTKFWMSIIYLIYSRFYWDQNQKSQSLEKLSQSLKLSRENQYDIWIINEKKWIIPLLIEVHSTDKMKDYILSLLRRMSPEAAAELKLAQKNKNAKIREAASALIDSLNQIGTAGGSSLRVYCLGKFRVFRDDEEIPAESWKSKKAKALFKYLVHSRHKGFITRDVFMELMWPEEDPEKSINRLHDALYSLRKILDPVSTGSSNLFLMREGDSYSLSFGNDGWVDVDRFQDIINLARKEKNPEKALHLYLNAENLYQGDYLEEDLYVEWCEEERAGLKESYLEVIDKIMGLYEKTGNYPSAIEYAGKYLKIEKYTEDVYRQLITYYHHMGNKTMVIKTYEKCKENMKKLDMPVSREIEDLFQKFSAI
ncbi:MAG: hypothetical protein MUC95_03040 [Spirochaetes bacterium]|nr:hypothetical protein [Spirochaetota bacterium]